MYGVDTRGEQRGLLPEGRRQPYYFPQRAAGERRYDDLGIILSGQTYVVMQGGKAAMVANGELS